MTEETHYQILDLDRRASQGEIKQAYRRLVKQFHPDRQPAPSHAERIIAINAAYEILGDPQRRRSYDAHLQGTVFPQRREQRRSQAQKQHQAHYQTVRSDEGEVQQWLKEIYQPLQWAIAGILNPLDRQIDELAADPFDDDLMADFLAYLDQCRASLNVAQRIFASRPNPPKVAKIAANLYYCLNHIGDGLEDFNLFTLGYDDHHLHTGCELWQLAHQRLRESHSQLQALEV
jgi:molecular chaperone DnaJ